MAIYEERLQRDLTQIRRGVLQVGEKVLRAYKQSVHALLTGKHDLAKQIILGDEIVNTAIRQIDERCHKFIAIHLPSGAHLRIISSIIRTNIEMERIGDYAVTISREAIQFDTPPSKRFAEDIERIADVSSRTLEMALQAFKQDNADLAASTHSMARSVETVFEGILDRLVETSQQNPNHIEDMFRLMHVFTKLIRVADQASNICNEVMFAVTGKQRPLRKYQIWFIDEKNTLSTMAEGIARKLYPQSAEYVSFSSTPVERYERTLIEFLKAKEIPITDEPPRVFDLSAQELQNLGERNIFVSMQGPIKNYVSPLNTLGRIPFRTVVLEWMIAPLPTNLEPAQQFQQYEERYREIAYKVRELIEMFKGEEAC